MFLKISVHLQASIQSFIWAVSQVLHPTCPNISNFRNVGQVKSNIQAVRYQILPLSRRSIYFFTYTRTRLSAIPIKPVFFISSNLFPCLLWLNFEYWLRCKSATAYVLHNFSNILAAGISPNFTWIFIDWVSAGFFCDVKDREKSLQNMFLQTQSEMSVHILFHEKIQFLQPRELLQKNHMIRINSYLTEIFPRVLLLGGNFSDLTPWLSFLLWWCLSLKIWVKPLVSRRSISHRLLCVPFFILTLQ